MFKDFYKILEVDKNATPEDIKKSYRRLALIHHPDKNQGNKSSEEKFKLINEAYEVLINVNKRILYDSDYENYYNNNNSNTTNSKTKEKESEPVTPEYFLNQLLEIKRKLKWIEKERLIKSNLYDNLMIYLNPDVINYLIIYSTDKINTEIINVTLDILNKLDYEHIDKVCMILSKLANGDNELINKIFQYNKNKKRKHIIYDYIIPASKVVVPVAVIMFIAFFSNSGNNSNISNSQNSSSQSTGELFVSPQNSAKGSNETKSVDNSEKVDKYADWDKKEYKTGSAPGCFNYSSVYDYDVNNKLEIENTTDRDAVIKLMKKGSNKCIRYVYIKQGETYSIRNIPFGYYYTKIAYGHDWRQGIVNGKCLGKFISRAVYKNDLKENSFIQFYKKKVGEEYDSDGNLTSNYKYNSMSLTLFVEHNKSNYESSTDEEDFNNDN
jgi:curved DNA-binding protein CbpA